MKDIALKTTKSLNFMFEADGVVLNILHGNVSMLGYYPRRKHPGHSDYHTHTFYEAFLVVEGTLAVHFGEETVFVEKNSVIFIAPNIRHYSEIDPKIGAARYVFHFVFQTKKRTRTTNTLSEFFSFPKYLKIGVDSFSCAQLELFSRALSQNEETLSGCLFLAFLLNVSKTIGKEDCLEQNIIFNDTEASRLYKIEQLCSSLYAEKISLALLAEELHLSERQVERIIKKHYGMGFHALITTFRLREAKELLLEGMAVGAVAEAVGYSSYSAFHRVFRNYLGISPNEYVRKMHTEG